MCTHTCSFWRICPSMHRVERVQPSVSSGDLGCYNSLSGSSCSVPGSYLLAFLTFCFKEATGATMTPLSQSPKVRNNHTPIPLLEAINVTLTGKRSADATKLKPKAGNVGPTLRPR